MLVMACAPSMVTPVAPLDPNAELGEAVSAINRAVEQAVRRCPEQYLWSYKRFKTRPPGENRFY